MQNKSSDSQHNVFKQGINNFQHTKYKEIEKYYLSETIKLSLITGPLYCISANMQFLNMSNIIRKSVSNNERKKINFKSSSVHLPFKPNFFASYKECVFSLYRQGTLGFYKGNFFRLLFFTLTNKIKTICDPKILQLSEKFRNHKLREIVLYPLVDMLLNPLLVIESRYSIQNRKKGFRIYNNIFEVFTKSWRELYIGASYSIPRNLLFLLGLNFYFIYPSTYLQIFSVTLAHVLSYPVLTIQRNKIFTSVNTEYLPKYQYNNGPFWKDILNNVGIFHLYRGFFSYFLATVLWHLYVPHMSKVKFYKNIFEIDPNKEVFKLDFLEDDEYVDEEK